jgi:hypothetical protein
VESQRALAAFLSTRFETQRIQIFDAKNQAHQVELTTQEAADLMAFKTEQDRASAQAIEALAKQAQELQLGYE